MKISQIIANLIKLIFKGIFFIFSILGLWFSVIYVTIICFFNYTNQNFIFADEKFTALFFLGLFLTLVLGLYTSVNALLLKSARRKRNLQRANQKDMDKLMK